MTSPLGRALSLSVSLVALAALVACAAGDPGPSKGTYTVQFPSAAPAGGPA